jgi:hypothetical protein
MSISTNYGPPQTETKALRFFVQPMTKVSRSLDSYRQTRFGQRVGERWNEPRCNYSTNPSLSLTA